MSMTTSETSGNATAGKPKKGGLEGVIAATTALSKIEGMEGRLIYRGYDIHDLARAASFEEVAFLLWYGWLPDEAQLKTLKAQLAEQLTLPATVARVLRALPRNTESMDALRTAASAWGAGTVTGKPTVEQAIALTARFPVFLAAFHRLRNGKELLQPRPELGLAANYLYLLTGAEPDEQRIRVLDAYLVLLADHGMNASTFTARVVASTESDIVSATVAAVGALKGPLHGGAPIKVLEMLQTIGTPENAEPWLRGAIARGERLMGFGHRVYRTEDPRSEELRELTRLADPQGFVLARRVEELALLLLEEEKPGRHLYSNVEYYSAALLAAVGLPGDLFTPTFAVGRVAGWTAHILEQTGNNRLIRPEAEYTGPLYRPYVPLHRRSML